MRSWASIEKDWQDESEDPDWTQNVVSYLDTLMSALDAGARMGVVQSVRCKQTLCKVVVDGTHLDDMNGVVHAAVKDGYDFRTHISLEQGEFAAFILRDASERNDVE